MIQRYVCLEALEEVSENAVNTSSRKMDVIPQYYVLGLFWKLLFSEFPRDLVM